MGSAEASHRALAQLTAQVDLQSSVLGVVNAFWLLGALVLLLVPLPLICADRIRRSRKSRPQFISIRSPATDGSKAQSRSPGARLRKLVLRARFWINP